ncbi:MAG: glycosyltransferase [Rhodoglobus sp.]
MSVTAIIPSIPTRTTMLGQAIATVLTQERKADALVVTIDHERLGAPANRDRALAMVDTEWTAPLDDDDWLDPWHLSALVACASASGADLVYPWFEVVGGTDPFPQWENVDWDDAHPHQVPITMLVRTDLLRQVGGWSAQWDPTQGEDPGMDADGNRAGEDYRLILRAVAAGATIVHLPKRSWRWRHHGNNTSGLASRW